MTPFIAPLEVVKKSFISPSLSGLNGITAVLLETFSSPSAFSLVIANLQVWYPKRELEKIIKNKAYIWITRSIIFKKCSTYISSLDCKSPLELLCPESNKNLLLRGCIAQKKS